MRRREHHGRSWSRRRLPAALGLALLCLPARLPGQGPAAEPSRREYLTPGLVIETGARTASCDVLVFTADGGQLLAAGDDKVVRTWDVTPQGLRTSTALPILRWPTFRESRGNIYAMAMSRDESRVVVAGQGRVVHGFDAAVLDRQSGAPLHLLKTTDADVAGGKEIYRRDVWAVAWSPREDRVALGTKTGGVWLWSLADNRARLVGVHPVEAGSARTDQTIRFLGFDGEDHLLSIAGTGTMRRWDLRSGSSALVYAFPGPIDTPIARSRDGSMLAAVIDRHNEPDQYVQLVSFPDARFKRYLEVPQEEGKPYQDQPQRVALSADGSIAAVAVRRVSNPRLRGAPFHQERPGYVLLYEGARTNLPVVRRGPAQGLYAESLAFHPTLPHLLAVAGGDDHEVCLWDTRRVELVGEPIRSAGSALWGVQADASGRYLAFQEERHPEAPHPNERGRGPWRWFDLQERRFLGPQEKAPVPAAPPAGDWQVLYQGAAPFHPASWYVQYQGGTPRRLPVGDIAVDEFPRCYTFLPADERHPVRLVVGHYLGVSVFELPEQGEPKRTRLFRGHEGYVTGLALAGGGKRPLLLSASRDQTIAGWNLEDWPNHPSLGAQFLPDGNRLLVGKVALGSPAWELGLNPDDEIVSLAVNGQWVYNPEARVVDRVKIPQVQAGVAAALAVLRDAVPGPFLDFVWRRPGQLGLLHQGTSLVERPVWRFFPTRGHEWVLWRWRDFAYDCSTNGDYFIGWHRNPDEGELRAPDFYRAEQFRARFLDPAGIGRMLTSWEAGRPSLGFGEWEPPAVTAELLGPPDALERGGDVALRVRIRPRVRRDYQAPSRLKIWLNAALVEEVPAARLQQVGQDYEYTLRLPADRFRRSPNENEIIAQCYSRDNLRGQAPPLRPKGPPRNTPPVLHGLIVGVGKYTSQRELMANQDARVLRTAWAEQKGKLFQEARLTLLTDEKVTPRAVLGEFERLAGQVRPDDLLVLYLGGHGVSLNNEKLRGQLAKAKDKEGRPLLAPEALDALRRQKGAFLFLCPDFQFVKLAETTIGFNELYLGLAKLSCHKLILLDACHAGAGEDSLTAEEDPIRLLTRDGVGPVILAACGRDEKALENGAFDFANAYGLFTIALRRMLQDEETFAEIDRDHNQVLTASEVAEGVQLQVERMLQRLRREGVVVNAVSQTPARYIPDREARLRLMKQ